MSQESIEAESGAEKESAVRQMKIRQIAELTGRDMVQLQNPWWGNEKFGQWKQEWFCEVEKESEKAVLLQRVVPVGDALGVVPDGIDVPGGGSQVRDEGEEVIFQKLMKGAWGTPREREQSGWVPKSAINQLVQTEGREDFMVFPKDEGSPEVGRADDADVVVREKMVERGRYRQYRKLAVDAVYEANQEIGDLPEEPWHSRWKFTRSDDFMCMTVADEPGRFAKLMQGRGYSVAIHQDLLED